MDELETELRRKLRHPRITVPEAVDRAVLDAAVRGIAAPQSVPRPWRVVAPLVGTAAAAALAFFFHLSGDRPETERRFDIVDAYTLSLQVAQGDEVADSSWDLNSDGRVDELDVQSVSRIAVALGDEVDG